MKQTCRYIITRRLLIFWTLFIGLGAVAGAAAMLADPTGRAMGMDVTLPYFEKLPFSDVLFRDFVFSGIALLIVNGISNLTAAALLFAHRRAGVVLGGVFGVTLMLWICIQFYMFPPNFMSTIYFVFGVCQAVTGYICYVSARQGDFTFRAEDYPHIGQNPRRLVVYFSRMGYVKKQAYEVAERTGAAVYEIRSSELTDGTWGFLWCGRYGMHRWGMPIEPLNIDLSAYDHVTVCSPIWVFSLSAPVRSFCRIAAGRIREADYVLLHHTNGRYRHAADEMDRLLGLTRTGLCSIRCRMGTFRKLYADGTMAEGEAAPCP